MGMDDCDIENDRPYGMSSIIIKLESKFNKINIKNDNCD